MIKLEYKNINNIFTCADIHGDFERLFNAIRFKMGNVPDEFQPQEHPLEKEEREENESRMEAERDERRLRIGGNDDDMEYFNMSTLEAMGFRRSYRHRADYDNSIIFVCGDTTFGFHDYDYYASLCEKFNKLCELNNTFIFFIRGNHDDPSYFEEMKINLSHIKCIPDYSVVITANHTTLCVGGGVSIDRIWRKQQEYRVNKFAKNGKKKFYWENEAPTFDESKIQSHIDNGLVIDSIVSHSAPNIAMPQFKNPSKEWLKMDKNLKNDMMLERQALTNILEFLFSRNIKIVWWAYGHFHLSEQKKIKDIIYIANNFPNVVSINNSVEMYMHDKDKKLKIRNPFIDIETTFSSRIQPIRTNALRMEDDRDEPIEEDDMEAVFDEPINNQVVRGEIREEINNILHGIRNAEF